MRGLVVERSDSCISRQHIGHALTQCACAFSVNDPHGAQIGDNGIVQRMQHRFLRLVSRHSSKIDLRLRGSLRDMERRRRASLHSGRNT